MKNKYITCFLVISFLCFGSIDALASESASVNRAASSQTKRRRSKTKTRKTRSFSSSSSSSSDSSGYIRGRRGGCYYINRNGNKTYVDRSLCN